MAGIYRTLQSDFSAGEIDPMVEANLNLPYRQIGLRESYNTLHLPNATVSKRPGLIREITTPFGNIDSHLAWTPVEVQMESGKTAIAFLGSSARVILDGAFYDVPIYASDEEGETETISLAAKLRHVAVYQQYIFISYPEDTELGILMLKIEEDDTAGVKVYKPAQAMEDNLVMPEGIGACTRALYVANGRLLYGSKNIFNASRSRTEAQKEDEAGFPTWMLDFTLSDWTYTWTYTYTATVDGYEVDDIITYQSTDGEPPSDPFTKPEGIVKRTRVMHKDTTASAEGSPETWEEYTVSDNYQYGHVYLTDAVIRTKDAEGNVEAHTTETYPDYEAYPSNVEIEKSDIPNPLSTHGVQVNENDMYGSSIKWITQAGRIIVGTETAIHIAVDQYIAPSTFDLVITSYTGTSALQPKLLNTFVIFTSADRRKLYMGIFSDETKGLSITEMTATVRHLFLSGIKDYFISDNPYRVIYVLTNDDECRVCIPVFGSDGSVIFGWSTWDFGVSHPEYICFDRRAEDQQKTYFIMKDDETGKGWIYTLDYREPYLYGVKDTDLLLDYADVQTVKNVRGDVTLTSPFLGKYDSVDVMLTYSDGKQAVLRNVPVEVDAESGAVTIFLDYARSDLDATADATMKVGRCYVTRMALFQQLLPNNSGIALQTKHSINQMFLQIYRSQGGSVYVGDVKKADVLQLRYGHDLYNDNSTNPLTGKPYTFTGIYTIDSPVQNTTEDDISIRSEDPYPFNLMAVSFKYTLTEVN